MEILEDSLRKYKQEQGHEVTISKKKREEKYSGLIRSKTADRNSLASQETQLIKDGVTQNIHMMIKEVDVGDESSKEGEGHSA